MDWLWQGIILIVLGSIWGSVMTWLGTRVGYDWPRIILCSLAGVALTLFVWNQGHRALRDYATINLEHARPALVESTLRDWLDAFSIGARRLEAEEGAYFTIMVTTSSDSRIIVRQPKKLDGYYLVFTSVVEIADEHMKGLIGLPSHARHELVRELRIELAKLRIGYGNVRLPLKNIYLERSVPIDRALSQYRLIEVLGDLDAAIVLISQTLAKHLQLPT